MCSLMQVWVCSVSMFLGALFRDGNVCVACTGKTRRQPSVLLEDGHVKTNSVVFLEDFFCLIMFCLSTFFALQVFCL